MKTIHQDDDPLELLPIEADGQNKDLMKYPGLQEILAATLDYYSRIGYNVPWIGYLVRLGNDLVGSSGFKGKPVNGRVEIAYGTMSSFQGQGIGTRICRKMVLLAMKTDPTVRICARTFENDNASSNILRKNNFVCLGTVMDDEDGEVWEWEYQKSDS